MIKKVQFPSTGGFDNGIASIFAGRPFVKGFADTSINVTAVFNEPLGLCIDPIRNNLYVADRNNHVIRCVSLVTNNVTTLCGTPTKSGFSNDFPGKFNQPIGITLTRHGELYIVDRTK